MNKETMRIKEVLRYLQMPYEKLDEKTKKSILESYELLEKKASPRWIYEVFPLKKEEDVIIFEGTALKIQSKDLRRLFTNSDKCYVMAVTLGIQVDQMIARAQLQHMGEALFLDACANVMIEEVCDKIEQEIAEGLQDTEYMTMRFSPGYGDVSLKTQEPLIEMLQTTRRIGLTLSKSCMLLPLKSVTAFIGISTKKENRQKSCQTCMMKSHCMYRKRGDQCGS